MPWAIRRHIVGATAAARATAPSEPFATSRTLVPRGFLRGGDEDPGLDGCSACGGNDKAGGVEWFITGFETPRSTGDAILPEGAFTADSSGAM